MVVQDEINILESNINEKADKTMSVMLCTRANFVKKNSCLLVRIVSFNTTGPHLFTFQVLEPYTSKDIELDLGHFISH